MLVHANRRDQALVEGRRHGLWLVSHLALAVVLLGAVGISKGPKALELRRLEGVGRAWLKGATQEQLRGQQRGKVHVECGAGSLHIGNLVGLSNASGIDVGDVGALGVAFGVSAKGPVV